MKVYFDPIRYIGSRKLKHGELLRERSANNGLRQVGATTLALSLTGEADNLPSLGGLIRGAKRGIYRAGKYGVIGFTKNAVLEYATRGLPSMPLAG